MGKIAEILARYGARLEENQICKNKPCGVFLTLKKGRLHARDREGALLFSGRGPESVAAFVEAFWFWRPL